MLGKKVLEEPRPRQPAHWVGRKFRSPRGLFKVSGSSRGRVRGHQTPKIAPACGVLTGIPDLPSPDGPAVEQGAKKARGACLGSPGLTEVWLFILHIITPIVYSKVRKCERRAHNSEDERLVRSRAEGRQRRYRRLDGSTHSTGLRLPTQRRL